MNQNCWQLISDDFLVESILSRVSQINNHHQYLTALPLIGYVCIELDMGGGGGGFFFFLKEKKIKINKKKLNKTKPTTTHTNPLYGKYGSSVLSGGGGGGGRAYFLSFPGKMQAS